MMSLTQIELLADAATLERGRDYFRRGRVIRMAERANGSFEGVVEGEHYYRVTLTARSFSCDCPVGVSGVLCKHCVAVALAAAATSEDSGGAPQPAPAADDATVKDTQKRILEQFRGRRHFYDWRTVSEYSMAAGFGIEQLRDAAARWGAAAFIPTIQKAISAATRTILKADDSNGEIGGIVDELLELHAELCASEPPPVKTLVDWLITFQFDGKQDFFEPDVAAYANPLGAIGLRRFRDALDTLAENLETPEDDFDHTGSLIRRNRERLAVAEGDPAGLIAAFGELTRSYRMHDLAKALIEIGALDLAIEFAERGASLDLGWQAEKCGHYWCELLREHRPTAEGAARQLLFDRWPTSMNALRLAKTLGPDWAEIAEASYAKLEARSPRDLIETLLGLELNTRAWREAQRFQLGGDLWTRLIAVQQKVDPASVIPALRELVAEDLRVADARNYRAGVKRLKQLRTAYAGAGRGNEFEVLVSELREQHQRRPRLMEELRRAGM